MPFYSVIFLVSNPAKKVKTGVKSGKTTGYISAFCGFADSLCDILEHKKRYGGLFRLHKKRG
jgi:hypothetical protein